MFHYTLLQIINAKEQTEYIYNKVQNVKSQRVVDCDSFTHNPSQICTVNE